jgi:predicted acetyltransferase
MMQECVREAAREGFALSALYPSTQSLYRAVGFEQAGHRFAARLPIAQIDARERDPDVRPLGENDWPAVKACYAAFAPKFNGMLDRGEYVWGRIPKQQDNVFKGFGVPDNAGGLDGYVFLAQKRKETARQEVLVQDLAFRTAAAGRRLLRFIADFGTMGDDVVFAAGPSHPALMMLGLQKYKLEFSYYWMLRIVSVERALAARGYPAGVDAELHLHVEDDLLPENGGAFVLRVREGVGEVQRGGRGALRTGIRGLAAMYSGHLNPAGLALAGMAEGSGEAIAAAGAVFGGGAPWMTDFF